MVVSLNESSFTSKGVFTETGHPKSRMKWAKVLQTLLYILGPMVLANETTNMSLTVSFSDQRESNRESKAERGQATEDRFTGAIERQLPGCHQPYSSDL